jgi:hypothetical protein
MITELAARSGDYLAAPAARRHSGCELADWVDDALRMRTEQVWP